MTADEARAIADKVQVVYSIYDAISIAAAKGNYYLYWLDKLTKDQQIKLGSEGFSVTNQRTAGGARKYFIDWRK